VQCFLKFFSTFVTVEKADGFAEIAKGFIGFLVSTCKVCSSFLQFQLASQKSTDATASCPPDQR
jgi:hypothetical protein